MAQADLQRSEERYRLLFEHNPHPMWVFELATLRFMAVNQAAVRDYGFSPEEFLAMTIEDIRPAEDVPGLQDHLQRLAGEISGPLPWRHRRRDGRVLEVEVTSHPITWSERPARLVLAVDVTARRALEQQLRESQKIEALGRLAGGVAHDFNNLLTAILGYGELVLAALPGDSPLRSEIEEIQKAGGRAAALTRQLLAFSRHQVLQPEPLDLNEVIAEMHNLLGRLIGEHIDIEIDLDPRLHPVLADRSQLSQVLLNLALNARDAMPSGGRLRIATAVVVLDEEFARCRLGTHPGRRVRLSVCDNGCSMDEATKGRIFEPFFTTKPKNRGTGLGLATVYGIVTQSGGAISVASEVGEGTRVDVYLPLSDRLLLPRADEALAAQRRGGSETVLVVEDDDGVRGLASRVLAAHGFEVVVASSGSEALAALERLGRPVHLLLTDVVLPKMTGPEVAQRLVARQPGLRVLYMSGYTDGGIELGGAGEPVVALLEKPFTEVSLVLKVREVLDAPAAGPPGSGALSPPAPAWK